MKEGGCINFDIAPLELYGITEIADIQVGFDIADDDYNHIYISPRQVKTSVANSYDYGANTYAECMTSGALEVAYYAEEELYNQNGIRVVSEALITDESGEEKMLLEIVNDSSELVYVSSSDIGINGLMVYSATWESDSINPGTHRIMEMPISSLLDKEYWDAFGITEIGEFVLSLTVKDADYDEIIEPQEICVKISEEPITVDVFGEEVYNENGIRIISKGLFEDSSEYIDDVYMMFMVENNYSETISVEDDYGSLSLNDYMLDFYSVYMTEVPSGKSAIIKVVLYDSSLEENSISGIEDINKAEISFVIRKDGSYDPIAEPTVAIQYK